jgi:hypothetical protein
MTKILALDEILQQCQAFKKLHVLVWSVWKADYNRIRIDGGFILTRFPFSEKMELITFVNIK